MKHYRSLLLLPIVFDGLCHNRHAEGAGFLERTRALHWNQSVASGYARKRGKPQQLAGTPLYNALRQNLSTDGRAPEWPKVVISNLQIPADQMTLVLSLTLKTIDCIRFGAVLWHDAMRSERFSNLSLCPQELPKQSNNFVLTWKSFSISGKTSGQVRSDGPIPPYSKLPGDPAMERWLMNQFGLYYVGSLLTLVGYDPNFTVDDRRFWIMNIKG